MGEDGPKSLESFWRVSLFFYLIELKAFNFSFLLLETDANIPYDDIRYSHEEWPQHKSSKSIILFLMGVYNKSGVIPMNVGMPFGQLPVLEWRGQLLPQV